MLHHIRSTHEADQDRDGGFTLIELLVVIIILGILAAVVVFAVRGISEESRVASCETEERTVKTAVEAYNAREGSYPPNIEALTDGNFLQDDPTWWLYVGGPEGTIARTNTDPDTDDGVLAADCDL